MTTDSNDMQDGTPPELVWVADAVKAANPAKRLGGIDPGPAVIAIAAAGAADDQEADQILANEKYRTRLGRVWSAHPPDYPLLAHAVSDPDGPSKRLIDQVLLPLDTPGAELTRRRIADLELWRNENGSLDWFTASAPADLTIIGRQPDYTLAAAGRPTPLSTKNVRAVSRAGFTNSGGQVHIFCGPAWYGGTATVLTHSRDGRTTLTGPVTLTDGEGNAVADITDTDTDPVDVQVFLKRAPNDPGTQGNDAHLR